MSADLVEIDYTNHKGERRKRQVKPLQVWFGTTEFHEGEQWFLKAHDAEKNEERNFAMQDIHSWQPSVPERSPEVVAQWMSRNQGEIDNSHDE